MTKFIPVAFAVVAFGSSLTSAFAGSSTALNDRVSASQASYVQAAPAASTASAAQTVNFNSAEAFIVNQNARQH